MQDRLGQQAALEAARLLGEHLGPAQLLAHVVGLAALDGVEDRAAQAVAVDAALDQVVLRACGHRLDAALDVAVAGEHEVGDVRHRPRAALQRAEAARVGQPEVEQHAVDRLGAQQLERLGERPHAQDVERRLFLAQQLADQERIALVVLDEEEAQRCPGRRGAPERWVA